MTTQSYVELIFAGYFAITMLVPTFRFKVRLAGRTK